MEACKILGFDIITEILARLPIESIVRFKSICKTLYSRINSTYFMERQLSISKKRPSSRVIFQHVKGFEHQVSELYLLDLQDCKVRELPSFPLPDNIHHLGVHIMSTLDGLICVASHSAKGPAIIFNPFIREKYVILPEIKVPFILHSHHITIAFDVSINKYKAIRMLNGENNSFCEVITIGENDKWRRIVPPCAGLIHQYVSDNGGVFHQGSVYWIIDKFIKNIIANPNEPSNRDYILEFDVANEVFRVVTFPYTVREPMKGYMSRPTKFSLGLQILGGSLALIEREIDLIHIWRIVKGNGNLDLVFEYRTIKLELPYKYASIHSVTCPYGSDDILLLGMYGGHTERSCRKGNEIRIQGCRFCYYYTYSENIGDRFGYLWPTLKIPSLNDYVYPWLFKPSLVSI